MSRNISELKKINNNRYDYSKISGSLPLPNLVEIQTNSFKELVENGLHNVFKEAFPISNPSGTVSIDFVSLELRDPKHTYSICKEKNLTYSKPIYAKFILHQDKQGEMKEEEIYLGELPYMTNSGTFIVNGVEKAVISQLVRSPGAYLSRKFEQGKYNIGADLIPGRGTWLQFETDAANDWYTNRKPDPKMVLSVRIDREKKLNALSFLSAIGICESKQEFVDLFGNKSDKECLEGKKENEIPTPLVNTCNKLDYLEKESKPGHSVSAKALEDIFRKMKSGEPVTKEGCETFIIQKFFDPKRYDLGRAGRYKFKEKLSVYERLIGRILAEDLHYSLKVNNGAVKFKKGTLLTAENVFELRQEQFFEKGAHLSVLNYNENLFSGRDKSVHFSSKVNIVKVYTDSKKSDVSVIIGTDLNSMAQTVTVSDIAAIFSYFLNVIDGFGKIDDIDHLGNRRIRCVGELIQNQYRTGLAKMAKTASQKLSVADESLKIKGIINPKPLTASVREFFASSPLSQFMDQTNPLAELTNKRRLSALGPGGLSRDRASTEVRDVHVSHYGRICPIETPEGQNIGLINNLACYAKINPYGFIETPYRKVIHEENEETGEITCKVLSKAEDSEYLSADKEWDYIIGEANINLGPNGEILDDVVVARYKGENILAKKEQLDYVDVSPKQVVSIAAGSIPFLENDDTMRALMGSNMQRQALPLLKPHAPLVGTGLEHQIARDSGLAVVCAKDGVVTYKDSSHIEVLQNGESKPVTYNLAKFERSNQDTCINQVPIVKVGDKVKAGDIIADGPGMENGDLALGQNVTIAFMTWNGYNYEDAVIMSERLVKDDVYTSIHINKYEIESRHIASKVGFDEIITRDVPGMPNEQKAHLDENGIVIVGTEVKDGDYLVGKITPKGQTDSSPEEKLLQAIFKDKSNEGKDASLRVPHGGAGIVLSVKVDKQEGSHNNDLPPGVIEVVRVYIVQKRKISEGDKMSGRHGNKGVISRILPEEDMPFLPDGTPVDIMLNPLGVPSRMNIGQILEVHLGYALKKLGYKIATPVFDGITNEEIFELMKKANIDPDGKSILYDGRTGDRFDGKITVGVMYMIKLIHMVDDKLHARATGPYSLVTQQPLGGKAQNGGQRFGEMEVWALEAYGAAHVLQEIITVKSDDRVGRRKTYENIIRKKPLPKSGIPEAFKVLIKELQALALDVKLFDKDNKQIDTAMLAKEAIKEERDSIKNINGLNTVEEENGIDEDDNVSIRNAEDVEKNID